MNTIVRRVGGFIGIPLLSAIAPFLVLPILSRVTGPEGWGCVSAAQSIGVLGSIAVTFGWGIYGPPAVARARSADERASLYRDSLVARLLTFAVVAPVCGIVTAYVVNPVFLLDSVLMAVATAGFGLLPSWYCIGVGDPGLLARYDVLPRLAGTVASVPLVLWTGEVWAYPVLTIVAVVLATGAFTRRTLAGAPARSPRPTLRSLLRRTFSTAAIDMAGNAYGTTPVPIATASLAATDASHFGSADRAYRIGLSVVVVALGNAFQGWVLDPGAPDPRRRHELAITAHAVTGVLGGVLLAALGPWATSVFFGAEVAAGQGASLWFGVSFLAISLSTPLIRNLLIPAGLSRLVLRATVASAVVGVALMLVGAVRRSGDEIALALACSEVLLTLLLARPALKRLPSRHAQVTPPAEAPAS